MLSHPGTTKKIVSRKAAGKSVANEEAFSRDSMVV